MANETDVRTRLLDAARDLVAERGWSAATSRALADRAGANLALINYYFGSKGDLLLAALDRSMTSMADAAAVDGGLTALLEDARRFAQAQAGATSPDVGMLFAATLEAAHNTKVRDAVRMHLGAFRAYVAGAIEQSIRNGELPESTNAAALGAAMAAMLDGLVLHAVIDPQTDVGAALEALLASWRAT